MVSPQWEQKLKTSASLLLAVLKAGADSNKLLGSRRTARNPKWRLSPTDTFVEAVFSRIGCHLTSPGLPVGCFTELLVSFPPSNPSSLSQTDKLECFVNSDPAFGQDSSGKVRHGRRSPWCRPRSRHFELNGSQSVKLSACQTVSRMSLSSCSGLSVCPDEQASVWEGNGIVSLCWPPQEQLGLVGYGLLAGQIFPPFTQL